MKKQILLILITSLVTSLNASHIDASYHDGLYLQFKSYQQLPDTPIITHSYMTHILNYYTKQEYSVSCRNILEQSEYAVLYRKNDNENNDNQNKINCLIAYIPQSELTNIKENFRKTYISEKSEKIAILTSIIATGIVSLKCASYVNINLPLQIGIFFLTGFLFKNCLEKIIEKLNFAAYSEKQKQQYNNDIDKEFENMLLQERLLPLTEKEIESLPEKINYENYAYFKLNIPSIQQEYKVIQIKQEVTPREHLIPVFEANEFFDAPL